MGIGVVIVVLGLVGALVVRRAPGVGLAALGLALLLFCFTPMGSGLPGMVSNGFQSVSDATTSVVQQGGTR